MDYDPTLDWKPIDDGGFNSHIGPVLFARAGEQFLTALRVRSEHLNFGGVCHGGVYMALSDVCMGIKAHSMLERAPCATIDFEAHFLAAAKRDQWIVGAPTVRRAVSGIVFMECALWAGGRQVMKASGIWKALGAGTRAGAADGAGHD